MSWQIRSSERAEALLDVDQQVQDLPLHDALVHDRERRFEVDRHLG